jgi:hypothetical protein
MLNIASKELLPLSNTKQLEYEEVKYLSFEEALDDIAKDEEIEVNEPLHTKENVVSDEDIELKEELKKDIAGMFGN